MDIKSFTKLVELPTKVASVFPFLLGSVFAVYRYNQFNVLNFIIMFIAMICLDMATTALNNYLDYKKAIKTHGFNYEEHNAMVSYKLDERTVRGVIYGLVLIAVVLGLVLFLRTDLVVLGLGALSFFCAGIYTWGPFPISRTPLGELVSGVVMGGIITFISLYIHIINSGIISYDVIDWRFVLTFDIVEILAIITLTLPMIAGIANIMLANNTCDMEDDFENRRFTLPLVIGKENALNLFHGLYMLGYISVGIGMIMRWLPLSCVLALMTLIPVRKNILNFRQLQDKGETFILSVQNFIMFSASYVLSIGIGVIVHKLF